jgi:hypothetical protein
VSEPLNEDDPAATVDTEQGTVRNLSPEEYAATYAQGEPEQLPAEVLAALPTAPEEGPR